MSTNISYTLLVLAAAFAAACSGSGDMVDYDATDGSEGSRAPITILGTPGGGVVNTGASYGEYTAFINVPGKWSVVTTEGLANVYPSEGEGPTMAVVQVGENWGATRENVLTLVAEGATTRAGGESDYKMSIVQSANPELDSLSGVFSANKGAGYSYMPGGEYCDGALIPLFNLVNLDSIQRAEGIRLISDVIAPQTTQEFAVGNNEESLTQSLMVNASAGMNFSSVKNGKSKEGGGTIGVGVGKTHEEKSKNKHALKRLKTTQFTRDIQYANIMALLAKATTREARQRLLTPGFLAVQERFVKEVTAAKGNQTKQNDLCGKFLDEVGPCFISKSVMGTVLDYQISVDSTLLHDSLGIKVALEAKFQTTVKTKEVSGKGSFNICVSKAGRELLTNTTATVKVRGGDVSLVNILVTGDSLANSQVTAWQNSCRPALAAMVDMVLTPIYVLIADDYAREVLMNYFRERQND